MGKCDVKLAYLAYSSFEIVFEAGLPSMAQAELKFKICLPQPPKGRDDKHMSFHPVPRTLVI